ncbi:uncharacterized protein LOC141905388 [Tubulanus polymorphus]|uniref:uncharacterized protein LOC141905388 n=1 Tax=Tubulanus polymorphus TaxID=672921 RepID=UPI003DA36C90
MSHFRNDNFDIVGLRIPPEGMQPTFPTGITDLYVNYSVPDHLKRYFKTTGLKPFEMRLFHSLIRDFDAFMKRHHFEYMLFAGTLLGAYRHHGIVPWDEDFDVVFHEADMRRLVQIFRDPKTRPSNLVLWHYEKDFQWKIHRPGNKLYRNARPWNWPFIDMFQFSTQSNTMRGATRGRFHTSYRLEDIYPLVEVPFFGLWLPAPKRWRNVLNKTFENGKGIEKRCKSIKYLHRTERDTRDSMTISCSMLKPFVPFVVRTCTDDVIDERLTIGERVIYNWKYELHSPKIPFDETITCRNDNSLINDT